MKKGMNQVCLGVIGPCEWCLKVNSKTGKMVSRFCLWFSQPVQNVAVEMPILSILLQFLLL